MKKVWTTLTSCAVLVAAMTLWSNESEKKKPAAAPKPEAGQEVATFGAGCFWCTEAILQQIPGVIHVTSGYMGGTVKNPTYEDVCKKDTGHAEVAQIIFDPAKLPYAKLLDWFWKLHDPTQKNGQGDDRGPQYRSVIFYHSEAQKKTAEESKAAAAKDFTAPIVTEISAASEFWPAENYHQDYYKFNKDRNPYCPAVISPKLRKLGLKE